MKSNVIQRKTIFYYFLALYIHSNFKCPLSLVGSNLGAPKDSSVEDAKRIYQNFAQFPKMNFCYMDPPLSEAKID